MARSGRCRRIGGQDSQLTMFKDAGHAASINTKQPDLEEGIVIWFRKQLPVAGYATLAAR
jgi:hypothetical protein